MSPRLCKSERLGERSGSLDSWEDMRKHRLAPNLITFNSCIAACSDWQQALAMLAALENELLGFVCAYSLNGPPGLAPSWR